MESVEIIEQLGKGVYGYVYKIRIIKDFDSENYQFKKGEIYAMKTTTDPNEFLPSDILKEMCLLHMFDHSNILHSLGGLASDDCKYISIILPLASSNLWDVIKVGAVTLDMMYQIVCGVSYIHSMGVIHEDLKPENILVFNGVVKIADFGISSFVNSRKTIYCLSQTGLYRPPEIKTERAPHLYSSDLWALGVVLYVCGYGSTFYSDFPQRVKYFPEVPSFNKWPGLYELLTKFINLDPTKRITAKDALKDKLWNSVNLRCPENPTTRHRFQVNPKIPNVSRRILVRWMLHTASILGRSQGTKCLSVDILDRYSTIKELTRDKLQLAGCAALEIATDLLECYLGADWESLTDGVYKDEQVLEMKCDIVKTLGWKLYRPTLDTVVTDPKMVSRIDHCLTLHQTPNEIVL